MKEERVVRPSILDEPMHGAQDVLFCRLAHWILLVVGEDDHILTFVAEVFDEVGRHVPNIVDTASELSTLAKVVDADEEGFPPSGAKGVLERVVLGGAVAEVLRRGRGWRGSAVVSMHVRIRVRRRHICNFVMSWVQMKRPAELLLTRSAVLALGRGVVAAILLRWWLADV